MTQPTPEERLSAYVDGELDATQSLAFERELQRDAELRARHTALSGAVDTLRMQGPLRAPTDFHAQVMREVADEPLSVSLWARIRRPFGLPLDGMLLAVAAAAVLWVAVPVSSDAPLEVEDPAAARIDFERLEPEPERPAAVKERVQDEVARPIKGDSKDRQPLSKSQERKAAPVSQSISPVAGDMDKKRAGTEREEVYDTKTKSARPANFLVQTKLPDAQYALQRLVDRYGGEVTTEEGARPMGDELSSGRASFVVRIPGDVLSAFSQDLADLGGVRTDLGKDIKAGGTLELMIVLELETASGSSEPR